MRVSDLQYELPPERIAQEPADRRDASRLLVCDRSTGRRRHETFDRLPGLLPPGALLVLNDTRVLPARLELRRVTGGRTAGLFLCEPEPGVWEIMLTGSSRLRMGEELAIEASGRTLRLVERIAPGTWRAEPVPPGDAFAILNECGRTPLPPYIKRGRIEDTAFGRDAKGSASRNHDRTADDHAQSPAPSPQSQDRREARDRERYQTVYARCPGAIAAPTAGLHFTPAVFEALDAAAIERVFVTLHVGAGTFAPIRCDDLADHEMHAEWYECPPATASAVNTARVEGRPVVAVGTTSVRVLESCAGQTGQVAAGSGWTRLFIHPPYRYRAVDKLLTNFHLPGSTLLAMVFALAGRENILAAYEDAIRHDYRFYSYGDAMLIL